MKQYLAEAIGTFFLVLTVALCVTQSVPLAPLAIGSVLMVMVYAGGHVSGAHYNPAVTFALWLRGALPAKQVVPYWVAQFVGGTLGVLIAAHITGKLLHVAPGDGVTWVPALLAEFVFSFALSYVVLNVATAKETQGNAYFGLAIGFTVMVGAFAVGGISGGAFNPAVGLSPALLEVIHGHGTTSAAWIYAVGPLAGGTLAAIAFKALHPGE